MIEMERFDIDVVYSGGETYLTIECQRCPWIGENTAPADLHLIVIRAQQHQEVCPRD